MSMLLIERREKGVWFDKESGDCESPPSLIGCACNIPNITNLCDLCQPVEEDLGAHVVLVLADVVQEAAKGHELRDEHHLGGHADSQDADAAHVLHRRHHTGLLQQLFVLIGGRAVLQNLDGHWDLHILAFGDPETLQNLSEKC